jgi:8-oxo-dGTP pyrophosphatase MutT (NUDIX family)
MVRIERLTSEPIVKIDYDEAIVPEQLRTMVEQRWMALIESNPNYFNGRMISFLGYEPDTGIINARAEQYKHHAVRDSIDLGVRILSVTAILVAPDHDGQSNFLLGKRSMTTHRYGHLWEFGPCGGIDVPESECGTLDLQHIKSELRRESMEEIGIDLNDTPMTPLLLVHDDDVGSTDIVFIVKLDSIPDLSTEWEYADLKWVTMDQLNQWIRSKPSEFIPTAIEIARVLNDTTV